MSVGAPIGALVRIFYDGPALDPDDGLVTATGRVYLVVARRWQRRGRHVGRQHLTCLVASAREAVPGAVYPLRWYPRGRRR